MVYRFDTLESTNGEANNERYIHGDVVVALRQTAGRGQRGHSWDAEDGKNLTFSIVVCPTELAARNQFRLSQIAALAVADTLAEYGMQTRIKWTNDIYVADRKICGILIENTLCGDILVRSIIGIGLNVNQTKFPVHLPNPTSIALENGDEMSLDDVLDDVVRNFSVRYNQPTAQINDDYNALLYRRNESCCYIFKNTTTQGIIRRVEPTGELVIDIADEQHSLLYGDISFVI